MTLTVVTIRQPYCPRYTYLCYHPAAVKSPLHLLLSPFVSHTVSMALTHVTISEPYCLYWCHHSPTILSPWHLLRSPFASQTVSTTLTDVTINQPYCLYWCHNSPVILSQWHLLMSPFTCRTVFTVVTIHRPYCLRGTYWRHHAQAVLSLLMLPFANHTVSVTLTDVTIQQTYRPHHTSPWNNHHGLPRDKIICLSPLLTDVTIHQSYSPYDTYWCHHSPAMRSPWHLQLSPTTRRDVPNNLLLSLITSHRFPIILSESSNRYIIWPSLFEQMIHRCQFSSAENVQTKSSEFDY